MINPTSISTMPSAHGSYQPVKPVKPADPVRPAAAHTENRPLPKEPAPPTVAPKANATTDTTGRLINTYA